MVLRKNKNCQVLLGEVTNVDLANKTVDSVLLGHTLGTPYDSLIVAAGPVSHTSATTTSPSGRPA